MRNPCRLFSPRLLKARVFILHIKTGIVKKRWGLAAIPLIAFFRCEPPETPSAPRAFSAAKRFQADGDEKGYPAGKGVGAKNKTASNLRFEAVFLSSAALSSAVWGSCRRGRCFNTSRIFQGSRTSPRGFRALRFPPRRWCRRCSRRRGRRCPAGPCRPPPRLLFCRTPEGWARGCR